MVRRSFRIGLRVGLLLGIGFAVVKTVQSRRGRREPPAPAEAWKPITEDMPPVSEPVAKAPAPTRPAETPSAPRPSAEPTTAPPPVIHETPVVDKGRPMDEVGEPIEGVPAPDEPPAEAAPSAEAAKAAKAAKKVAKKTTKKTAKQSTKRAKKAAKKKAAAPAPDRAWVEPTGGTCPPSHPIKAKLSSKIFHLPGMFAYDRTNPDRCYRDAEAASGDGLRQAKR